MQSSRVAVVVASPWRIRESRRQAAKQRDKDTIKALRKYVKHLEHQLSDWWRWYTETADGLLLASVLSDLTDCVEQGSAVHQQGTKAKEDQTALKGEAYSKGIDYSKWDHLPEYYSSDDDDDDDDEEAEEEEEGDAEGEIEYDCPDHMCNEQDKSEEDTADEEGKEQEGGQFEETKDAEDDGESRAHQFNEAAAKVTNCGDHNKLVLLAFQKQACMAVRECFKKADEQLSQLKGIQGALATQADESHRQGIDFIAKMEAMSEVEFSASGCHQFLRLIERWRDDLTSKVHDFVHSFTDGG